MHFFFVFLRAGQFLFLKGMRASQMSTSDRGGAVGFWAVKLGLDIKSGRLELEI
jgi:hypothetical protein